MVFSAPDAMITGRIHFTMHYPELDTNSRLEVWKNFLTNVAKSSELAEFTADDFVALSRHALNGRQVRQLSVFLWSQAS